MKKIVVFVAAMAAMAPAAFAQSLSEAEMAEAKTYVPDGDFSSLTADQAEAISAALASGDNVASQINSILLAGEPTVVTDESMMLTEAEALQVREYAPDADLASLTPDQIAQIRTLLTGGENVGPEIKEILTAGDPTVVTAESTSLTEAEMLQIREYAPDADLANLTVDQIAQLRTILTGGDNVAGDVKKILGE